MNIRRFFATNSREAVSQVRQALGNDAVILSNRTVDGGTEILAMKEHEMDQMINVTQSPLSSNALSIKGQNQIDILTRKSQSAGEPIIQSRTDSVSSVKSTKSNNQATESHDKASPKTSEQSLDISAIRSDIQSMHFMLQSQLNELSWNHVQQRDPMKSNLLTTMLTAGFSASLSRLIVEKAPTLANHSAAINWLCKLLAHNMNSITDESQLLDQGGVFALVGPTGVGKTTTTAKLAARYVMKHGAKNLGLITTDAYRIGGHEQLRIYGKILGVMVHAVKDESDLSLALKELKNKHTILIDTVGVSQRDKMVAQQIAMLHGAGKHIKKLLCLNATCTGETLSDVTRAYSGQGMDGAIITKLDESASIGGVLDTIIREKLNLYYIANGQRVPEDLHLANKHEILQHAFKIDTKKQDIYGLQQAELSSVMANINSQSTKKMSEALSNG